MPKHSRQDQNTKKTGKVRAKRRTSQSCAELNCNSGVNPNYLISLTVGSNIKLNVVNHNMS